MQRRQKILKTMLYSGMLCSSILSTSCSKDDNPLVNDEPVTDEHITLNQVRFHYRDWGNPSAPPLIILHGLTGHAWEFDEVASALSDKFHVMTINQRGHGDSDWAEEYNPEIMANDVADFIDEINLGKANVIGHSMGGVNAWWLAAQYPEKIEKMVLLDINPQVISSSEIVGLWQEYLAYYAQAEYNSLEEGVAEYMASYEGSHEEALEIFATNNLKQNDADKWVWKFDAGNLLKWMQSTENTAQEQLEILETITCPTLIVKAGSSPFTDISDMVQMEETIPDSEMVIVPGSGHDIHIEQFNALLNELKTFLE